MLNPIEFVKAFGEEKRGYAESLLETTTEARDRLFSALPNPGEHIGNHNRTTVRTAILQFLRDMAPVNGRFLTEGLDVFRNELAAQLSSESGAAKLT